MLTFTTPGECAGKADPRLLREDHFLCLVMDAFLAVRAAVPRWVKRHRNRRALAELDEHQLRDIGLTRADISSESARSSAVLRRCAEMARVSSTASKARRWWPGRDMNRLALAELVEDQLNELSDIGRQVRREARQAGIAA